MRYQSIRKNTNNEQLVGSACVACQQRIASILGAENCRSCGNPIHTACKRAMEAGDGLEFCFDCGYPKASLPESSSYVMDSLEPGAAPAAQGNTALVVIGSLITVIGVGLLLGNITGFFPTFPFAGFIAILIGGGIAGAGKSSGS